MKNPRRFYTYAYLREDRTPYYIGKGTGKRIYFTHRKGLNPPKDKSRIIFLKQNLTEEEAFKHEIYMIAVFGRKDLGTGILHNKTDGGDGCSGRIVSEEQKINQRNVGIRCYKMKVGIHKKTKEQMTEDGRKSAEVHRRNKTGVFDPERKIHRKGGKIGGKKIYELGIGIHARTEEQRRNDCIKGGKVATSQKWICLETGFISNAGGLACYQRKRGIDTSKRKRIE
jgi:hypothetical protein